MSDERAFEAREIEDAYKEVENALSSVGRLLRTRVVGSYLWAGEHKSAVTGLRILVEKLRADVPNYGQHER